MRTLIGCLINTIAVMLLITAVSPMHIFADGDTAAYKKAKKDAADAVAKAEALKKKCEELKAAAAAAQAAAAAANKIAADLRQAANNAANAAAAAGSAGDYPSAQASDVADQEAADAGKAADDARDKANQNPNDNNALKEARAKETDAAKKEKAADAAAGKLDKNSRAERTAALRKAARAAERAARAAERPAAAAAAAAAAAQALFEAEEPCGKIEEAVAAADAAIAAFEKLLAEKIKGTGGSSKTEEDTETVSGWKDRVHPPPPPPAPPAGPQKSGKKIELPKPGIVIEPGADNVRTSTANGLQTVTFDTLQGTVTVNLPDDVRAGDTISGTVFTEPKGNTTEERAANQNILNSTVLDLAGTLIRGGDDPRFTWTPSMPQPQMPVQYRLKIVEVLGNPTPVTQSGAVITPNPPATQTVTNPLFNVQSLGQKGRPVTITGSFDGNSSNTSLTIQPVPAGVLAASPSPLVILAESKRMLAFRSATNVTGPAQITVNEGGKTTTLPYRSIGVDLSAPTTTLPKGGSTTLTARLEGLAGITQNVSFRLEKSGVVTMQGGDVQVRSIKPKDVQSDGSFTMTRTMTGRQSGAFSVVATVLASDRTIELRPR